MKNKSIALFFGVLLFLISVVTCRADTGLTARCELLYPSCAVISPSDPNTWDGINQGRQFAFHAVVSGGTGFYTFNWISDVQGSKAGLQTNTMTGTANSIGNYSAKVTVKDDGGNAVDATCRFGVVKPPNLGISCSQVLVKSVNMVKTKYWDYTDNLVVTNITGKLSCNASSYQYSWGLKNPKGLIVQFGQTTGPTKTYIAKYIAGEMPTVYVTVNAGFQTGTVACVKSKKAAAPFVGIATKNTFLASIWNSMASLIGIK